jgi:hypothetical protein
VPNVVQPNHRHPRRHAVSGERLDRHQAGVGPATAERQMLLGLPGLERPQRRQRVTRLSVTVTQPHDPSWGLHEPRQKAVGR